jgi:hypothetical protein
MKARLWFASLALIIPSFVFAQAQPDLPATDFGPIQVKSANIGTIDTSHLEIVVSLALTPGQSGTLKNLQLCSLRMNGLPVFANPVEQEIVLKKGEPTQLPPLTVSVYYHDLYTTHPLAEMIDKQSVRVEGELVSDLQVGFLGKLALHSQHPRIVIPLNQEVPVAIGGSALERRLALGALQAMDSQMSGDSVAGKMIDKLRPAWIQDLEKQAPGTLVVVQSTYSIEKDKNRYEINSEALGFRLASGNIITSTEMLNPWKYDAEFLAALNGGQAKLVKNSQEVRVTSLAAGATPLLLTGNDFSMQARGTAAEEKLTAIGKSREQIHLQRRASPSSLAVLTLRTASPTAGIANAPDAVLAQSTWEKVLVFRLRNPSKTGDRTIEPVELAAKREENSIRLNEPVDASVFGSPIIAPEGVIGIVQDEWTGTLLPVDLKQTTAQAAQR